MEQPGSWASAHDRARSRNTTCHRWFVVTARFYLNRCSPGGWSPYCRSRSPLGAATFVIAPPLQLMPIQESVSVNVFVRTLKASVFAQLLSRALAHAAGAGQLHH